MLLHIKCVYDWIEIGQHRSPVAVPDVSLSDGLAHLRHLGGADRLVNGEHHAFRIRQRAGFTHEIHREWLRMAEGCGSTESGVAALRLTENQVDQQLAKIFLKKGVRVFRESSCLYWGRGESWEMDGEIKVKHRSCCPLCSLSAAVATSYRRHLDIQVREAMRQSLIPFALVALNGCARERTGSHRSKRFHNHVIGLLYRPADRWKLAVRTGY